MIRILAAIAGLALVAVWLCLGPCRGSGPEGAANPPPVASETASSNAPPRTVPPVTAPLAFAFPTPQQHLADTNTPGTFMPTLSGRTESALFGFVRTSSRGGPAFHEGLDIAPVARNRQGGPADAVYAVAEGTVGYVNRVAGNSNYGLYVVLLHREPVGEFYTLYAHLASIEPAVRAGTPVQAGSTLGVMGHTPSSILPPARGHLHFEIGLMLNSHFDRWYRAQKMIPDHGNFNGQNFLGIDPQSVFRDWNTAHQFALLDHLTNTPPAFTLLVTARQPIDFFARYPALWQGDACQAGIVALAVAGSGIPVAGRMATAAETTAAGARRLPVILQLSPDVSLPARRLILRGKDNTWRLSPAGAKWLEVLLY